MWTLLHRRGYVMLQFYNCEVRIGRFAAAHLSRLISLLVDEPVSHDVPAKNVGWGILLGVATSSYVVLHQRNMFFLPSSCRTCEVVDLVNFFHAFRPRLPGYTMSFLYLPIAPLSSGEDACISRWIPGK